MKYLLLSSLVLLFVGLYLSDMSRSPKNGILTSSEFVQIQNEKAAGYKKNGPEHFADYHYQMRKPASANERPYAAGYKSLAIDKARKSVNFRGGEILPWISRGPSNVGGRTRAIWVDPTDAQAYTWVVGSAGGGIWKTMDAGQTWSHKTEDLPNLSTSTIAGCLSTPNVLYAGTGEGYGRNFISGNGILKSNDSGDSWQVMNNTIDDSRFTNITRIVVNPQNADEVMISTLSSLKSVNNDEMSYIFCTNDGGNTWIEKFQIANVRIQQIVANPSFTTFFASFNSDGIYRSTDLGDNWERVYQVSGNEKRLELATAPSDPSTLFASVENDGLSEMYWTIDNGDNWTEVQGNFGNWLGFQGWYDNAIAVNPFNRNQVFTGGNSSIISILVDENTNVGQLEVITDGYGAYPGNVGSKGVHVDHHNITLIPRDEASGSYYILNGNDGGISFSQNKGLSFAQTGDSFQQSDENGNPIFQTLYGYNTSQFYGLDKMNGEDRYIGGTQDNGSFFSPVDPSNFSVWLAAPSGDGFEAVWHYTNPDLMLETSQFNGVYRSDDRGLTWRVANPPGNGPFISRLASSKQNPSVIFGLSDLGVVKSTNFADDWEVISMPSEWDFDRGGPIEISIADPFVVWTGRGLSSDHNIFVSTDGGSNFKIVSQFEERLLGHLVGISTDPYNKDVAYATFGAPGSPKVLRTRDLGQYWEDLSGYGTTNTESDNGFPDVLASSVVVMPHDSNQIWVGTDIGIVESLDGGNTWALAQNGLPALAIYEMKIVNDEVILATHGQGIWSVEIPELKNYVLPQPFISRPDVVAQSYDQIIEGMYTFSSSLDSSVITFELVTPDEDILIVDRLGPNEAGATGPLLFDISDRFIGDTILMGTITVQGFKGTLNAAMSLEVEVYNIQESISKYSTDFSNQISDFARIGFVARSNSVISD